MPAREVTAGAVSRFLGELARTMVVRVSVSEILDDLVARLAGLLPVTGVGVSLVADGRAPRQVAATDDQARGYEMLQTQLEQGPCVVAYETGAECISPDLSRESRFPAFAEQAGLAGLGAVFAFPLTYEGKRLGAMDLYRDRPGTLTADELAASALIADVVSAFLVNAQQRDDLERLADRLGVAARRDPLTQLANRVALCERLELAFTRWKRSDRLFTVLFVDIDDFKTVNDRHGHGIGDRLLTAFASRLSSAARPVDLAARLGGDEFAIVCEDLRDLGEADQIVARIEQDLQVPFADGDHQITLTASIGIGAPGPGQDTPEQILQARDGAMSASKRRHHAAAPSISSPRGERDVLRDAEGREAMSDEVLTWHERLIQGDATGDVAFTSVLWNHGTGDLVITQYDRRAMLLCRYEWQAADAETGTRLTVSDWEDQPILDRSVEGLPPVPTDQRSLKRLLDAVDE